MIIENGKEGGVTIGLREKTRYYLSKQSEERLLEYYTRIRQMCLMDDDFMRVILKDRECTETVLQVILNKPDLKVEKVDVQYDLKSLTGRSLYLDVKAVDENGKHYDIEVQRSDDGADPKRARFHSAMQDSDILKPGQGFEELPEAFVIFITENDVLGKGLPIYHVVRKIEETGETFSDESHIIYVNSQIQDDTELGRLMQDFWSKDADTMHYETLAKQVKYHKETEKGVKSMCKIMDEIREDGREEGRKEGRKEGESIGIERVNTLVQKLLQMGRTQDLLRTTRDREFQNQLLEEFGI